jgi:hypothetical protein
MPNDGFRYLAAATNPREESTLVESEVFRDAPLESILKTATVLFLEAMSPDNRLHEPLE